MSGVYQAFAFEEEPSMVHTTDDERNGVVRFAM